MFWWVSQWLLVPSLCPKTKAIFLWLSLWELGRAPGSKTHKRVSILYGWSVLSFLFQVCPHWPAAIHQLQFRFALLLWVPVEVGSALVSWGLCVCLSLQRSQWFALWLHFSRRSKKSCWFFSGFAFYLEWRDNSQLLSCSMRHKSPWLTIYSKSCLISTWHHSPYLFSPPKFVPILPWAHDLPLFPVSVHVALPAGLASA